MTLQCMGVIIFICTAFGFIIDVILIAGAGRANPFPVLFYGVLKTNDKIFQVFYVFRARHLCRSVLQTNRIVYNAKHFRHSQKKISLLKNDYSPKANNSEINFFERSKCKNYFENI